MSQEVRRPAPFGKTKGPVINAITFGEHESLKTGLKHQFPALGPIFYLPNSVVDWGGVWVLRRILIRS